MGNGESKGISGIEWWIDLKPECKFKEFPLSKGLSEKTQINMDPWGPFVWQGSPKIILTGSPLGPILGSMKVQDTPLVHIIVQGYPNSSCQSLKCKWCVPSLQKENDKVQLYGQVWSIDGPRPALTHWRSAHVSLSGGGPEFGKTCL